MADGKSKFFVTAKLKNGEVFQFYVFLRSANDIEELLFRNVSSMVTVYGLDDSYFLLTPSNVEKVLSITKLKTESLDGNTESLKKWYIANITFTDGEIRSFRIEAVNERSLLLTLFNESIVHGYHDFNGYYLGFKGNSIVNVKITLEE